MVLFGFITALKSASRSVSESPRTWTIWCPAGGLCWLGSIVPEQSVSFSCPKMSRSETHKKEVWANPKLFFFFTQEEMWKSRRHSVKVVPGHSRSWTVEDYVFSSQTVLAVEICGETQRFPVVSCWHTCECNKAHIYSTLESMLSSGPNFTKNKSKRSDDRRKAHQTLGSKCPTFSVSAKGVSEFLIRKNHGP